MEDIKYQFELSNYANVIRIADRLLSSKQHKDEYLILMYKASSLRNLLKEEEAILIFKEIVLKYPDKVDAKLNLALTQILIGEFIDARKVLKKALELDSENLDIISNQIYIEEQLHNFDEVIRMSTIAINIDPEDPSNWLVRSNAYDRLGKYENAITDGKQAVRKAQDDEIYLQAAYNGLGYTYSKIQDYKNAEYYLMEAIKTDDTEPFQYNNLGWVLANQNKIEEGLKYINYSLQLDPDNSYAYKNRGKVYMLKGNFKMAKKEFLKAKELDYEIEYDNEVNQLLDDLYRENNNEQQPTKTNNNHQL